MLASTPRPVRETKAAAVPARIETPRTKRCRFTAALRADSSGIPRGSSPANTPAAEGPAPATPGNGSTLECAPGDPVLLGLPERSYLILVFRLYAIPLLSGLLAGVIAFALAAYRAGLDGAALDGVVGLSALLAAGAALRQVRAGLAASFTRFSPRMMESDARLDCRASGRIA